ncbi:unnamed protein product [Mytilus coruscus]|uniref:Uncharacterized protein n=1 Tax=Mytilus coruscus TaxID=42192 RepID=A0A6J8EAX2_MYTCO|nr:unnamed protein product [Mytilus coruscus]
MTAPSETSEVQTPRKPDKKFNGSDLVDNDSFSTGGIAIGITVVIFCIVVAIVCYQSRCFCQNLRYIPSVISYLSGYNVSNLKIPDAVSVEQIEVNATFLKENSIPGNHAENVSQLKAQEESVNPEKIQFAERGSKTEFETCKTSDENDTDQSGSDDGRYLSSVINQADDDDDRYVSIVFLHFDIDRDNIFPGENIERKKELIVDSCLMKNGLIVADKDDEKINVESNEENDNTEIQTKENGVLMRKLITTESGQISKR